MKLRGVHGLHCSRSRQQVDGQYLRSPVTPYRRSTGEEKRSHLVALNLGSSPLYQDSPPRIRARMHARANTGSNLQIFAREYTGASARRLNIAVCSNKAPRGFSGTETLRARDAGARSRKTRFIATAHAGNQPFHSGISLVRL